MMSNTSSTEITMSHAIELVLSRGFSTTDAASMTGVKEADLSHLTHGKPTDLTKDEGDSVVLCCMRLCQMGFTIDISVIEARFQEAMKKRSSYVKLSPHALNLVCEKLFRKNHHLLQSKLPYQPKDSRAKKLKAFYSDLQRLYEDVNLKDSTSVLAFAMKEFRVLNAAGNKMQCVTALSVISPANLNLPIMVIFPVPVTYKDSYPGQILITSKDGVPSSNLVTHYLRAVFDLISVRPLLIFFDGHENLLSLEFVSECINKSIILRCVPRDISDMVFPGKHGGILHNVSKIVGSELMGEKTFLDNISFHIWEDWWATWQGMCKAFQTSGIFPLKMSAITDSQQSTISDNEDPNEEQSEDNVDEDSSQIVVSSDEDKSDEESETSKSNEKLDLPENESMQTENQETELKGKSLNLNKGKSHLNTSVPHSNLNLNRAYTKSATPSAVENELKRKTESTDRDVIQVDTSSEDLSSSDESVTCAEDSARSKKLFIHIDDDEKENQDTIVCSPFKKMKVSHTESHRTVASTDSLSETIDSVIAASRVYYDTHILNEESVSSQQPGNKDRKEKKSSFRPGLKLKLSTKRIINSVNNEDEKYKDSFIKSNEENLKEIIGRNNNEHNEDKMNRLKVIEVEDIEEDGEDETKSDEEVNNVDTEMSDRNEIGYYKPERTEKETSGDESDLEVSQQSDNSSGIDDKKETCEENQPKRQKKKKKKKNKNRGQDDEVLAESQENTNQKERTSKRKKKKKRKKKEKRSKTCEDDEIFSDKEHNEKESSRITNTSLDIKDTSLEDKDTSLVEKDTSLAKTDSSLEKHNFENSMLAMKTISLADHDYDAKFDSDSGHELVEETACEDEKEDTDTLLMKNNNQGEDDKHLKNMATLSNQNEEDKKETSDSSSDSDSSHQSGSRSSNNSSSSSSSNSSSSSSSNNSSGDDSSDSNEDEGDTSNQPAVVVSDSQSDQSSEEKEEENGSGDSDSQAKKESSSNSSEENQSASDDEASSKEQIYSDAEEDDESGDDDDDDDSKCQLCMASNPPHSNVKVIDWVDCDNNCGRWFHVVCIHRSKSKIDPKHFVCPSCRCIR